MSNFAWMTSAEGKAVLVNLDLVQHAERGEKLTALSFGDHSLWVQEGFAEVMRAEKDSYVKAIADAINEAGGVR